MRKTVKAILVAAGLAVAATGAVATSADAHPWGGPGPVIGAGILGVAIGASLAHPYYGPPPACYRWPRRHGYGRRDIAAPTGAGARVSDATSAKSAATSWRRSEAFPAPVRRGETALRDQSPARNAATPAKAMRSSICEVTPETPTPPTHWPS